MTNTTGSSLLAKKVVLPAPVFAEPGLPGDDESRIWCRSLEMAMAGDQANKQTNTP